MTAPVSFGRAFRWAYAAIVEVARAELEAANAAAEPGAWPAGQSWAGLGSTSRSIFVRRARRRLGIDDDAFLAVVRSGVVDVDDLWDGELLDERKEDG